MQNAMIKWFVIGSLIVAADLCCVEMAHSQAQVPSAMMPLGMPPITTLEGVVVIPVVVPQYMIYTPPPVAMMSHRPAQLVIPQYPAHVMPSIDDLTTMQIMQQQMMMQQQIMPMMPLQMIQPPAPPQQPVPIKMILPDGSKVSIKHYVPGSFFKNFVRAVTP